MKNKNDRSLKIAWAPWRMEYIRAPKPSEPGSCIFCIKPDQENDKENLILYRGEHVFVIMNLYPYNNGHLMIVPYRHISEYSALSKEERHEMADVTAMTLDILKHVLYPNGFNVGYNLGEPAGAGIAEHIHQHIVPRWTGDTNFMPVLGHTKVMVDGLIECWTELKKAFETYKQK